MRRKFVLGSFMLTAFWLLAGVGVAVAAAEDGKKVFAEKKCISCHGLGSEKGAMAKLGGPLDGVGSKRDAAWLKGYFADPKSQLPNAKMPKQHLSPKEIDDLVQYMLTVK
jgi:mono/diheme cytochrome c family protein